MTATSPVIVANSHELGDTLAIAGALAHLLAPGDLVLLAGEMGSGKTAFAQGVGAALGVDEPMTSPTFTIVHTYEIGRTSLHHIDVYRLDRIAEVADLAVGELLEGDGIVLVEWGDVVASALPGDFLEVRLSFGERDDDRLVALRVVGPTWAARQRVVAEALEAWRC